LEQASRIDGPGIVTSRDLPSQTLIDNALKGVVQDRGTVLTLLADPAWSQRWLEGTAIEGVDLMLQGAGRWLGSVPLATHVHRWRHAFALRTHPAPCVQASHPLPMVWCGDGFGTETLPGVETAWVSGMAAARAVLERT
jgi:predicted NAD/FAD-dependent oxidoreductase